MSAVSEDRKIWKTWENWIIWRKVLEIDSDEAVHDRRLE